MMLENSMVCYTDAEFEAYWGTDEPEEEYFDEDFDG